MRRMAPSQIAAAILTGPDTCSTGIMLPGSTTSTYSTRMRGSCCNELSTACLTSGVHSHPPAILSCPSCKALNNRGAARRCSGVNR